MEWLILPTTIFVIAFLVNGFSDKHSGTKTFYKKDKTPKE